MTFFPIIARLRLEYVLTKASDNTSGILLSHCVDGAVSTVPVQFPQGVSVLAHTSRHSDRPTCKVRRESRAP